MTVKNDWVGIARSLSEIEERYRKDRLRVGSAAQPAGAAREQLIDALERAVECYLDADDQQRQDMRDFFRVADCLPRGLLPVAGRCQDRMHEGEVEEQLRRGLAAVSLENFHSDVRDSFDCLGGLYLVAHQLGVNPQVEFDRIAALSSTSPSRGYSSASMHEVLGGFDRSEYFRADVQRKLKREVTP